MDAIALGCLTAILLARHRLSRLQMRGLLTVGVALLGFVLCFSRTSAAVALETTGLDMSVVGFATCMLIAVAAQTQWKGPGLLKPLYWIGQRSYEIYLTHMFLVLGLFAIFVRLGKPLPWVWALFLTIILAAALLGDLVARSYSEPMNVWLRQRWGEGANRVGSVRDPGRAAWFGNPSHAAMLGALLQAMRSLAQGGTIF